MKTKPDDESLALWMDGELEGAALERVEAWVADHPELLAERDAARALGEQLRAHIAADVEPPYPEFFNQKILRTIADEANESTGEANESSGWRAWWQWLSAPVAVPLSLAAMALCFYLGTQMGSGTAVPLDERVVVSAASVYTPDGTVHADMFRSSDADATVIVLEGLEALPDELEMAAGPLPAESGAVMVGTRRYTGAEIY